MITHPPASCALSSSHPALRTSLGIASLSTPRHFLHPCKLQLLRHHLHATRWTVCLEHSTPAISKINKSPFSKLLSASALLVRTWILTSTGSTPTPEPVPVLTSLMFPYALHCMEYYIVFFRDKSAGNTLKSARMESLCIERKCCMWVLSLWIRYPDIHSYMYDSASLVFTLFLFVDNFQGDYQPNRASVHLPMVIWDFVILTLSFHTLLGKKIHYLISTCFSNPF